jgi:hypothetical protein
MTLSGDPEPSGRPPVGQRSAATDGTDQSKTAMEGQQEEAAKAQIYAAHLPPEKAEEVLRAADETVGRIRGR